MSNLRQAAASSGAKKTYQTENPEDSRYRTRLIETLKSIDPSLSGKRLERALTFFDQEWEVRDQSFLKRFTAWAKKARTPTLKELKELAKFGDASGNITVSKIANNLGISFQDALFRTICLVSWDLGVRHVAGVDPGATPALQVELAPRAVIEFVIGLLETGEWNKDGGWVTDTETEIIHLTQFFAPEINAGVPHYALTPIQHAFKARTEYESTSNHLDLGLLAQEAAAVLADTEEALSVGKLAEQMGIPVGLATFLIVVLVSSGYDIERAEPYFTRQYGGTSLLRVRNDVFVDEDLLADSLPMAVEIGDLSPEEAKAMLQGDLGKAPREFAKAAFEMAKEQADQLRSDPHMHSHPERVSDEDLARLEAQPIDHEDDLAGILDSFDGGVVDVSEEELMETLQQLEDRLQGAEELAQRVHALENELNGLRMAFGTQLDAIAKKLGVTGAAEPPASKGGPTTAGVVINIVRFLEDYAADLMPIRPNNQATRETAATNIAKEVWENFQSGGFNHDPE